MNKKLPNYIKKIFREPDPLIWEGIWLEILNSLLMDDQMVEVWKEFIALVEKRHTSYSTLPFDQLLKWESKGFVAQVIKNQNNSQKEFVENISKYFSNKGILVKEEMILTAYKAIN